MASVRKRKWVHKGVEKEAWVVAYTDQGGKRRVKTFPPGKKKDADAFRSRVEIDIRRGDHVPDANTITVSAALDIYIEHLGDRLRSRDNMRRTTVYVAIKLIERHLRPQLGGLKLTHLTAAKFQACLDDIAATRSRSGQKPYSKGLMMKLASFMRLTIQHCQSLGYVARNVLAESNLRIPGTAYLTKGIPTKTEIGALLNSARGGMRPLVYVAIFAGLRKGEIRALRWSNIDLEEGVIHVVESASRFNEVGAPKTKASIRDIPMAPQLKAILVAWRMLCPKSKEGRVFPSMFGGTLSNPTLQSQWCQLQKDAGISDSYKRPKYHFHSLRHVAASLLIESGLPPKRIQHILGHTSIKLTFDLYGHLFEDQDVVRSAMDKIAGFFTEAEMPIPTRDKGATRAPNQLISLH